jgi:type II secretory pathway component GspD/PulD (secretin)
VSDSEVISVSAEPVTNSLIVSAGKRDMERVRSIVERLDVSGSTNLPEPRVIALRSGKATQLASSLMRIFSPTGGNQGSNRGVMIVGDEASNALIVRSTDEEFIRIRDLAVSLQDQASTSGMTVRVVRLGRLSATRLAQTVQQSFQAAAQERGEALAVSAERGSNALVIASSLGLFEEIERLVRDLDGPDPDGGGGVAAGPGQRSRALALDRCSA